MEFTVEQCRAGRALLGWSMGELANAAGLGVMTVNRFEGGQKMNDASVAKLKAALEEAGVRFMAAGEASDNGGQGVRFEGSARD